METKHHFEKNPHSHHLPGPPLPPPPQSRLPDTCLLVRAIFNRRVPSVPSWREKGEVWTTGRGEGRGAPDSERPLNRVLHRVGVGPPKICANSRCGGISLNSSDTSQESVAIERGCRHGDLWSPILEPSPELGCLQRTHPGNNPAHWSHEPH